MPFRELTLELGEKENNIGMGIDVSQKCQCECPTCFYEPTGTEQDMPFDRFKRIVDEAETNNFSELYLLGGEPSLHPGILDFIDYGLDKDRFNPLILVSNGLKLADDTFCKEVADRGVTVAVQRHVIGYDIDAARIHDTLMGIEGTLPVSNRAFENIGKYFSPDKVAIQCCVTRPVYESGQIYNVFEFAREHGYEQVMECTKAGDRFPRGSPMDVTPDELLEVFKTFQKIDQEKYPELAAKILTPQAYGKVCHMPETGVHVLTNGDVVPCVGQQLVLGNIDNTDLKDMLESDKRKFFQYPEARVEGECKECDYLTDCTGGCRGDAFYVTGCFNASAVQCPQHDKVEYKMGDFVPSSCSGCDMEDESICNVKSGLREDLEQYLKKGVKK